MKSILTLLYLFLFVYFVSLFVAGDGVSFGTQVEDIALTCGTSMNSYVQWTNYSARSWIGDISSEGPPIVGSSTHRRAPVSPSAATIQVPYDTARLSYSEFTYRFNLTTGQKFIRLYFYPVSYADFDRSKALFSIKAGDFTLVDDFNTSATADTSGVETIYREFCLNIDEQQSLRLVNIKFTPVKDAYAFINGIEIGSMPTYLYHSAPESHGFQYVGGGHLKYRIENNTCLETFYRLDIGKNITQFENYDFMFSSSEYSYDMFRNWDADEVYLDGFSRESRVLSSNYTILVRVVANSAPEYVYRTGRTMGVNNTINRTHKLTWTFPVDSSFHYLVRLHFCELESDITRSGDRKFQIELANRTVEEGADIIQWSGGNGIPVYRDYVVYMSSAENEKKVNLSLSLAAFQKDGMTTNINPILNGLEILKLLDSNGSFNAEGQDSGPQVKSPKRSNKSTPTLALVAGVVASILVFSVVGFLVFRRGWRVKDSRSSRRMKNSMKTLKSTLPTHLCRYFSLAVIKAATENFNVTSIIGVGGFGNVYKGWIDGGVNVVAIKRLKQDSSQGAHEFETEIELLSQIRHRHLVSLIGYCNDKGEMILVYDYMARGTLSGHLYNTDNPPLPWKQRLEICIGAARGLQYLHSGVKGTIIHRDVKSTNILLDENWVAKVSDFGLSKGITNVSKTHISTLVKGSFGYLDPEYYRTQHLTEKSDVYSLGVVLCEVLCARPAVIPTEEIRQASLAEWTKSCHQNGELDQIIDPRLRGKIAAECLNKFIEVAISCMRDNGTERPSMAEVVRGLELALQLQQSAEGNINCTEKNVETETSSSEQSCATNDSIKCISSTIFSDINNSSGR